MSSATCGMPVIESDTRRRKGRRIRMRRCGAPAVVPAIVSADDDGPIWLAALCAQHSGDAASLNQQTTQHATTTIGA